MSGKKPAAPAEEKAPVKEAPAPDKNATAETKLGAPSSYASQQQGEDKEKTATNETPSGVGEAKPQTRRDAASVVNGAAGTQRGALNASSVITG